MILIKMGGGADINIEGIIKDISEILKEEKVIIVHGANAKRDKIAKELNLPKKVITSASGYSSVYSDKNALDLIMMSYSGIVNKRIVETCQRHGLNAVGLSGIDGRLIQGQRNKGIRVKEADKLRMLRDFSGKPKEINSDLLQTLLKNNYLPVLSIPILDENGFAINSENDDIIALLSEKLKPKKVIQFIEEKGLLLDKKDPDSFIPLLSKEKLDLLESKSQGRIKRKLLSLKKIIQSGSHPEIIISEGRTNNPLKKALNNQGTLINGS